MKKKIDKTKICVIGLGYVGLPLAYEFSRKFKVIGYDLNKKKIQDLKQNIDITGEIEKKNIKKLSKIRFTYKINDCIDANIYIVTVPTPILKNKKPDLRYLIDSCKMISKILKKDDLIVFESTTYPGCTEEVCIPLIEKKTKLKVNEDFYCGYSPERVNPSDKKHKIPNISKIVSGSNLVATKLVYRLYSKIIRAKVVKVTNIKVAEAAKIIENTQRDINIAFMNELLFIFNKQKINIDEVLKASSTKWNFLNFKPGLVGGHCIGVDPYYLDYKAKKLGINTRIISSGRKINDSVSAFIAKKIIKISKNKKNKKILILGITFKEDCNDFRNSKVFDLISILRKKNFSVTVLDPVVNKDQVLKEKKIKILKNLPKTRYSLIFSAVRHSVFVKNKSNFFKYLKEDGFIYDFQNIFPHGPKIIKN